MTRAAGAGERRRTEHGWGTQWSWTLTTGDGTRVGEEDGTSVRDISLELDSGPQLVRAGDDWVIVNADGDNYPPALAVGP